MERWLSFGPVNRRLPLVFFFTFLLRATFCAFFSLICLMFHLFDRQFFDAIRIFFTWECTLSRSLDRSYISIFYLYNLKWDFFFSFSRLFNKYSICKFFVKCFQVKKKQQQCNLSIFSIYFWYVPLFFFYRLLLVTNTKNSWCLFLRMFAFFPSFFGLRFRDDVRASTDIRCL